MAEAEKLLKRDKRSLTVSLLPLLGRYALSDNQTMLEISKFLQNSSKTSLNSTEIDPQTKQLVERLLEFNKTHPRRSKNITLAELDRKKRQVLEAIGVAIGTQIVRQGVGLIAATVTSNLVSSVWNRIWPGEVEVNQKSLNSSKKLLKNFDIVRETVQAVSVLSDQFTSALTKVKDLFRKNTKYMQSAQLVSGRILSQSQDLLRVVDTAKDGKVHTHC